eukprot:CCRYP_008854-RA/>CCRYP_008854-RA protein AED:0.36 eAED:0.36 QI:134/1/1/1/1/1/2/354/305
MTANEIDTTQQIQAILLNAGNAINGHDSDDSDMTYPSIAAWKSSVLYDATDDDADISTEDATDTSTSTHAAQTLRRQWYKTGYDYYEDETKCPATVNGVLGGFAWLSQRDLKGSKQFLQHLQGIRPEFKVDKHQNGGVDTYALECGAGIGRVSKGLLFPLGFTICDLVEPSQRLLSHAPEYIGSDYAARCRYFCTGLQDFVPQPDKYNIIFIQWVIGYLTDEDLVAFLKRCAVGLRPGGVIIIKDNTCTDVAFIADRGDASVTRSLPYILAIVKLAGLRLVYEQYQDDFPSTIFPVPMLAFERDD